MEVFYPIAGMKTNITALKGTKIYVKNHSGTLK